MIESKIVIFWFRRDLRLEDNSGLYLALKSGFKVLPIFIFDRDILDSLQKKDARVLFIHQEILRLKKELENLGSSLRIYYGKVAEVYQKILQELNLEAVYFNRDYEPYARKRDQEIYQLLKKNNIKFIGAKDQVIFEKNEVLSNDNKPYTIFTPYGKKWKSLLNDFYFRPYPNKKYFSNFLNCKPYFNLSLENLGFEDFDFAFPKREIDLNIVKNYKTNRDFPAIKGTTHLSLHLRFGTISIRNLCKIALENNQSWLNELIWRDFYQMIIFHFPDSAKQSFKKQYDRIIWRNDKEEFKKWCEGKTGYPIVDAGMRELNSTGFMHNRVRMIVASFLCKHLLVDWRLGEKYFAQKLLDYDLASNVGGWQWAAGSGCDAVPYFRIFNPELQTKKFDPKEAYIRRWLPELGIDKYVKPIVDHKFARERCLEAFKKALKC